MPITPTYPGVYIDEVSSGVRTITGVPTAIAAFVGRAYRGPVDEPVRVQNWGDFERAFGGLRLGYPLGNAVYDFFRNGGGEALVVRMFVAPPPEDGAAPGAITRDGLVISPISPGSWGGSLRLRVDTDNLSTDLPWVTDLGLTEDDLFNLTIYDTVTRAEERYVNLTVVESPRRVDRILERQSALVRVSDDLPDAVPGAHGEVTPDNSDDLWTDDDLSTGMPENAALPNSAPLAANIGDPAAQTGLYALDKADIFNILVIPQDDPAADVPNAVYDAALRYCVNRRAMLILDPPLAWNSVAAAVNGARATPYGLNGTNARNAAIYFPRVQTTNPLLNVVETTSPAGLVAGAYARTDAQRGVWKAPAGIDVALNGTQGLEIVMTDAQNGQLNPLGVNCLRSFPIVGRVIWGARTLRGADVLADEYKYVPIRRLALFIEESLYRGTQWVVFEPNDEPLWSQIRLNVGAFMHDLFRQGAFQGQTPRDAYLVKCDKETTTQFDRDRGIVNIVVGFAPLKPAEFVILRIQQLTGQQNAA